MNPILPFTILLLIFATSIGAKPRDLLVVANKAADTVWIFDASTYEKVGETATGRGPHELAIIPNGQQAWVTNTEGPGDTISIISLAENREIHRLPLGPRRHPHGIQFTRDGTTAYVTMEGVQAVYQFDVSSRRVVRELPTDQPGTHMLLLSADEQTLYASNLPNTRDNVTIIDLKSGEIRAHLDTGAGAEGMALTPDGGEVWVANRRADTVSIIDTTTHQVVKTFEVPGFPLRLKFTPDGRRALISCATAGEVAVIDVASRELIRRIPTATFPEGLVIEPNGERAFVANARSDTVSVIDLATLEIIHTLEAGRGPDGIDFYSTGP